jgi:P-type E1-E2 ATPase
MRTVDTVLFDKTGTLTKGEPALTHIAGTGVQEERVLAWAAAAEADSEHPLAQAIVTAAADRGLHLPVATDFRASAAVGVTAIVDGRTVAVGGPHLLAEHELDPLPEARGWAETGSTVLHVLIDGHIVGVLGVADEVRPESDQAVEALHALGIEVVMITGDAEAVAEAVAAELGIDQVFAGVRPEHKSEKVVELQREGRTVAMVGDGVNDAPALAQADVGVAIGAGTDVAIASAGVILVSDDPRSVLSVIQLSRAGYRKMKQNLWWAAGYNLISVPLRGRRPGPDRVRLADGGWRSADVAVYRRGSHSMPSSCGVSTCAPNPAPPPWVVGRWTRKQSARSRSRSGDADSGPPRCPSGAIGPETCSGRVADSRKASSYPWLAVPVKVPFLAYQTNFRSL